MAATGDRDPSFEGREASVGAFLARARGVASARLRAIYGAACALRNLAPAAVALFTLAYFAATCDLAALKPFSFDELTTYNIARQPTAAAVWNAWFQSGDGVCPLVHLATHLSGAVVGFSHVGARLPDMVGFWLMCLCVFAFLRRRVCPMLSLLGMLLPVTVPLAYSYAYEARGYGMVLGFVGAAVLCWDLAHDTRWRRLALFGLPLSLAAAITTHLYAVLVAVPLALGELARTIERRRVDWWVWTGLAAAGLLFLPANPFVSHIRQLTELSRYAVGRGVSMSQLMELWPQFLSISPTYLGLLALVCLARDRASATGDPRAPDSREGERPVADWALAVGLMALPAIGWLFANLITGLLLYRYVIAAVIGFSVGVPLLCQMATRRRPEVALLLAGWVAVVAAGSTANSRYALRTTLTTEHIAAGQGCFRLLNLWQRLPAVLPIVVSDFNVFHQMHHYAPDALKPRLLFVVDPAWGGLIEPYIPYYAKVFGEHMERLDEFLRKHHSFYLYDCGAAARLPLLERLLEAGASVRDSGLVDTPDPLLRRDLYHVSLPDGPTESARSADR